mmetsp:Transcript_5069/g.16235  ORF Transcript_5069/g.16235 Transcript_5069/m.16235 type:complete len:204 (-) Transcript_5069:33-644(-)
MPVEGDLVSVGERRAHASLQRVPRRPRTLSPVGWPSAVRRDVRRPVLRHANHALHPRHRQPLPLHVPPAQHVLLAAPQRVRRGGVVPGRVARQRIREAAHASYRVEHPDLPLAAVGLPAAAGLQRSGVVVVLPLVEAAGGLVVVLRRVVQVLPLFAAAGLASVLTEGLLVALLHSHVRSCRSPHAAAGQQRCRERSCQAEGVS